MAVDQQVLQEELKPPQDGAPDALVVEMDGSMLPIRGPEPWKEAKVSRLGLGDRAWFGQTDRRSEPVDEGLFAHVKVVTLARPN